MKKTIKTPPVSAAVFDLTCCSSVLCLKASFCTTHKYITVFPKLSRHSGKNIKKGPLPSPLQREREHKGR